MPRSFRFDPPEARADVVHRPRLLRVLLGRWERRITLVVGGAGFGKTTLLAQALTENRLAPRGDDVWIGVEAHDSDGDGLAGAVLTALAAADDPPDPLDRSPVVVAEAVWQRAPNQVCLVFDNVNLLRPGSDGARWLASFLEALPANGHLVLASRSEPPLALARLAGQGAVQRIDESLLRLSPAELEELAARRGVPAQHLDRSGGWPAMAELSAGSGNGRSGSQFLWEEVLEPLGDDRRRLLAVVSDLGGADDRLASVAMGEPVDVGGALADVPLVAAGGDGWHVPHQLWRAAPGLPLPPDEQAEVRRRAVPDLVRRDRLDQAFSLVEQAGLWDMAPLVLRAACLESERLNPSQLARFLAASPTDVRASAAGSLAAALRLAFTQPAAAIEPLRTAAARCREAGDVEAELTALAQLGRLAWGRQDLPGIGGEVVTRIAEIEATGNRTARSLAAFVRALMADLGGDDAAVLAELDTIEPGVLDPVWSAMELWFRGGVRLDRGEVEAVAALLGSSPSSSDPAIVAIIGGLRVRTLWAQGRIDDAVADIPAALRALRAAGVASIHAQGLINASLGLSYLGDIDAARDCLAEALATSAEPVGGSSVRTALAEASLLVAEGDEAEAAAVVRRAMGDDTGSGPDRRAWRHMLALSYILIPETRAGWDAASLRGHLATARTFAAALVAAREGRGHDRLWALDLSDLARVRSALHFRHAAELAVHVAAAGRTEGVALVDALGAPGRGAIHEIAAGRPKLAKAAKVVLAAAPAPPPQVSHLGVLGPLVLRRGAHPDGPGVEVADPDLRRARVRELLGYLVGHRRTHRAAAMAALWPDLDDRAGSNNLAVTLNYLLKSLEPWRRAGEPPYLIRLDGSAIELATGDFLQVDVDEFERHLGAAARAEDEGTPSGALDHYLAACALYRGDLLADATDAEWLDRDRAHYRTRFVSAAGRAAQLLVGHGDPERAEELAKRALEVDPWNEDAYTVLASAALLRGNRAAARTALSQCLSALEDLGATATDATWQLARRCGVATPQLASSY